MRFIEPHAHMVSRTTDDYADMATAGCVALCEPAFWAGFDRGSADGFRDYFRQLTEVEPRRAANYGIKHFTWLCINPKESEDMALAADVLSVIPEFMECPNVLGIGEIGLNKNSRNEIKVLQQHVDLAAAHDQLILVHTPHLEDKHKGTRLILDVLKYDSRINPERVMIDHVEEQTIESVLDAGYWAGMTLYPVTKCSPRRAVDILEKYPREKLLVNSSADWGPSDPFTLQESVVEFRRRGHTLQEAIEVYHNNPCRFLGQNPKWDIKPITVSEE